ASVRRYGFPTPLTGGVPPQVTSGTGGTVPLSAYFQGGHTPGEALSYALVSRTNAPLISTISLNGSTGDLNFTFDPAEYGSSLVTVRISDTTELTTTASFLITRVQDPAHAPVLAVIGDQAVAEGSPLTFANPTDPSAADRAAGLRYSYDLNNDGTFDILNSASPSASFTFAQPGAYVVRGRVSDRDGGFTDYTAGVTVSDAPPRVQSAQVNGGAAQRSRVTALTITFDSQVVLPDNVADAFALVRTGAGG